MRLIADVRTEQYLYEIADAFSLAMNQMHLQLARTLVTNWTPAMQDSLRSLRDADIQFVLTDVDATSDAERLAELGFDELHLSRRLTARRRDRSRCPTRHLRSRANRPRSRSPGGRFGCRTTHGNTTHSSKPAAISRAATSTAEPSRPTASTDADVLTGWWGGRGR